MGCGISLRAMRWVNLYESSISPSILKVLKVLGLYERMWGSSGVVLAGHLVEPIEEALQRLKDNPDYFKNISYRMWSTHDDVVEFLENLRDACVAYPESGLRATQ